MKFYQTCLNCIFSEPISEKEFIECTNSDSDYHNDYKRFDFCCSKWIPKTKPDPDKAIFSSEPHNNS